MTAESLTLNYLFTEQLDQGIHESKHACHGRSEYPGLSKIAISVLRRLVSALVWNAEWMVGYSDVLVRRCRRLQDFECSFVVVASLISSPSG